MAAEVGPVGGAEVCSPALGGGGIDEGGGGIEEGGGVGATGDLWVDGAGACTGPGGGGGGVEPDGGGGGVGEPEGGGGMAAGGRGVD